MSARDDYPTLANPLGLAEPSADSPSDLERECHIALDELDRLRRVVQIAEDDADRLADFVERHTHGSVRRLAQPVLARHDEVAQERDR